MEKAVRTLQKDFVIHFSRFHFEVNFINFKNDRFLLLSFDWNIKYKMHFENGS